MDIWIRPDQVFDGQALVSGQVVHLSGDEIAEVAPNAPVNVQVQAVSGILTPGYLDLQVNGGGDVLLNSTPTRAGMQTMAEAHRRFGTVGIMPTVITDHPDVLDRAADAAIAAKGDKGILGLHIEGPHISQARRGTHAGEFVRSFDERTMAVVAGLRKAGVVVMITVAPEAVTTEQIAKLASMGAIVSLGHTDASAEGMKAAIDAGAECATHLFNAMSPMSSRQPGAVGAVINSDLYSGIICDGVHVDDAMVGLACRARPVQDRLFLVSDSMSTVGGRDSFELYGAKITLQNGRLLNAEGSLAGAHVTQAEGVRRLVRSVGLDIQQALRMAVTVPAACIRAPAYAELIGRRSEDVVLLTPDLKYHAAVSDMALAAA
ncbi:MAG: N-acetylglucosamine-6-phosphate deacetylase [Pseudoruegeria sp.]